MLNATNNKKTKNGSPPQIQITYKNRIYNIYRQTGKKTENKSQI